jgi:hypothetical protein
MRYEAFKENMQSIEGHDSDQEGFQVGLNAMSDWT